MKDNILELNRKCELINREISATRAKDLVGKEKIRVKLKLYETCLMPTLLCYLKHGEKMGKDEMNEIEKTQGKALKRIFNLPISTSHIGLIIEAST